MQMKKFDFQLGLATLSPALAINNLSPGNNSDTTQTVCQYYEENRITWPKSLDMIIILGLKSVFRQKEAGTNW